MKHPILFFVLFLTFNLVIAQIQPNRTYRLVNVSNGTAIPITDNMNWGLDDGNLLNVSVTGSLGDDITFNLSNGHTRSTTYQDPIAYISGWTPQVGSVTFTVSHYTDAAWDGTDTFTLIFVQTLVDTQAPTAPTLSLTTKSDAAVDLAWSGATDNVAITAYEVYRDNTLITTLGNVASYQVMGLTASTTYEFKVKALDAAGNVSAFSNAITVTTDSSYGGGYWAQNGADIYHINGDVGIGTTNPNGWKLAVKGKIRAEEIKVETGWADYVFDTDYDLPTLKEVEAHIAEKGHLINIPSAEEVEANGIELGEMNKLLLEKIEELTLYLLQQQKEINALKQKMMDLSSGK